MRRHTPGELMEAFERDLKGGWTCVRPIELTTPKGRVEVTAGSKFRPGDVFMNVDLSKWLDEQTKKGILGV